MKKFWFKVKDYGWGWYPASWQGWLVIAAWVGVLIWIFRDIDSTSHSGSDTLIAFFIPLVISVAVLIAICWFTGERPSWRWGGKNIRQ